MFGNWKLGLAACKVWTCHLSAHWFVQGGPIYVKYPTRRKFRSHKIPSTHQAGTFFWILTWNSASWQQLFLKLIIFQMFVPSFDVLKIPLHCSGIHWKRWLVSAFSVLCLSCFFAKFCLQTHDQLQCQCGQTGIQEYWAVHRPLLLTWIVCKRGLGIEHRWAIW